METKRRSTEEFRVRRVRCRMEEQCCAQVGLEPPVHMSPWPEQTQCWAHHIKLLQDKLLSWDSTPHNTVHPRGHAGDVQDIAWAPDSSALMSGSIENICIMWDVEGTSRKCRLEDHRNYVQVCSGRKQWPSQQSLCSCIQIHVCLLCCLCHSSP